MAFQSLPFHMQPLWMQEATLAQLAQECTVGLRLKPSGAACDGFCRACDKVGTHYHHYLDTALPSVRTDAFYRGVSFVADYWDKKRPKYHVSHILHYEVHIKAKKAQGEVVAQRTETALLYAQEKSITILLCDTCHLKVHANYNEELRK
jgi:hypothetical protein